MVMLRNALLLGLFAWLPAAPASACAMLLHGDPKVGSVVDASLKQVTLTFSGKIFPNKSALEVTDAEGRIVSTGKPFGDDTTLAVKLAALQPGKYKVHWNTYCECKSYTPGDYKFTVR